MALAAPGQAPKDDEHTPEFRFRAGDVRLGLRRMCLGQLTSQESTPVL